MAAPRPWTRTPEGITLTVRLTPRGGRDRIEGVRLGAEGRAELLARVAAPPVEGEANRALVRLVAKALGVPRSAVRIAGGETGRSKRLAVAGNAAALEAALMRVIGRSLRHGEKD